MITPISFLVGVGVGCVLPVVARVFRPIAVEATAAGLGLVDEVRRLVAEQAERVEDIVAEARARREQILAESERDDLVDTEAPLEEVAPAARARRRANGRAHGARSR